MAKVGTGVIRVRIFRNKVDDLVYGRNGPVNLHKANLGRAAAGVARQSAPRDTGALAGSVQSRLVGAIGRKGYDVELVATAPHAVYVVRGNRAHWPPVAALAGWALRHGFPAKGGAFLVAQAISRKARPANNFLVKAARAVGLDARERR